MTITHQYYFILCYSKYKVSLVQQWYNNNKIVLSLLYDHPMTRVGINTLTTS